jgi:hypothetical protein
MRDLLKLKPDVPVEIALSCADGVNVVSPRGTPAVKYTLVDGRTFFATQYVATKFRNMGIEPNERIRLCVQNIDGKSITLVERVLITDPHTEPQLDVSNAPQTDSGAEPEATAGLVNGLDAGNHQSSSGLESPDDPTPEPSNNVGPRLEPIYDLKLIHKGNHARRPTQLERALKTAILASHFAEQFGRKIGYAVRFDQESIKSMAVTLLIGMQGGRN